MNYVDYEVSVNKIAFQKKLIIRMKITELI